jgi:hypothetical protein
LRYFVDSAPIKRKYLNAKGTKEARGAKEFDGITG